MTEPQHPHLLHAPLARRGHDLERLANEHWDLLIVGGGIVGAGALLDAASRGMRVALVEQDDIAVGTSSRSSRLIHGGLRYLQQMQIGLVREALAERARLLRLAPHLVRLESFLFPLYGPPAITRAIYTAGMTMYDLLGSARSGGPHRHLSVAATLDYAPHLRTENLQGALLYHDAMEDDARYALAVVRTAIAHAPDEAVAVTRVRATGPLLDGRRVIGAAVEDRVTGTTFDVRAAMVLDATGVWGAQPDRPFGGGSFSVLPARGSHLVIPRERIPALGGMTLRIPGRVAFLVPWPRHWLIGTTDQPFHGPIDRPATSAAEVDEILGTLNGALDLELSRDDIVGTYAGLRPLIAPSTARSSVRISREHKVSVEAEGLVRVSGGKYTTYRVMARDAVDAVLGDAARVRRTATGALPIIGAAATADLDALASRLTATGDVDAEAARSLVDRHGTEASDVLELGRDRDMVRLLVPGFPYLEAEVAWAVEHELAMSRRRHAGPQDPAGARGSRPRSGVCAAGGPDHGRDPGLGRRAARRRGRHVPRGRAPRVRRAAAGLMAGGAPMSDGPFVLALDQGTTSSRAIAFDSRGVPVASAQREFPQGYPSPGHVTHDPEDIWSSQLRVAREVVDAVGGPARIAAIGVTNQRETTIVWDRATGRPVAPAIVWQSRITAPFCDQLRAAGHEPFIRERTGLPLDAYFSGPKIRHIIDAGGLRARAERGELAFGTVDSWLVWRLTGGRVHATDVSNASRTLLLDLRSLEWDDELLALMEVPRSMLPEVRPSSAVWGESDADILGRPIPIAGVAGDQQAAMFGQACFAPGDAKNTYGTGAFLLANVGDAPIASAHGLLSTALWQLGAGGPVAYALEGSVFIAGAAVQWLRDGLRAIGSSSEVEELMRGVEDTGGVYLVPAFVGLGAPHWDPHARGPADRDDARHRPAGDRARDDRVDRVPGPRRVRGDGGRPWCPACGPARGRGRGPQRRAAPVPGRSPGRAGGAPDRDRDHGLGRRVAGRARDRDVVEPRRAGLDPRG